MEIDKDLFLSVINEENEIRKLRNEFLEKVDKIRDLNKFLRKQIYERACKIINNSYYKEMEHQLVPEDNGMSDQYLSEDIVLISIVKFFECTPKDYKDLNNDIVEYLFI